MIDTESLRALAVLRLFADGHLAHRFGWCPDGTVHGIRVVGCRVCDALMVTDRLSRRSSRP